MKREEVGPDRRPTLIVDETHMGRRATGIERITADLFSQQALPTMNVLPSRASGNRVAMMLAQMLRNPFEALRQRHTVWVFPGYPPSPAFALLPERSVLYVHDLFLMTRLGDLNLSAKLYMVKPFRLALRYFRYFMVNSEATGRELEIHVSPGARILSYRPEVRNVFGLNHAPPHRSDPQRALVLGALGTIEPRKNYGASVAIREALESRLGRPVELHIIGRPGWGPDFEALSRASRVKLHGFLGDAEIRSVFAGFDAFLCTSHAEGLGLPLLESQYAGIPVIAPDQPVFREVLGESGTFIDPADPQGAAGQIEAVLGEDRRERQAQKAIANIERWNGQAAGDRVRAASFLETLARNNTVSA